MIKKELNKLDFKGNILTDIDVGKTTAFKTKALCNYFIEPFDLKSLSILVKYLKKKNEDFFILGGGYNTLIKTNGIKIIISFKRFFHKFGLVKETKNEVYLNVQAGAMLQKICWHCAIKGYQGLNSLIGIPGTIGGAVFMNAGTKKGDIFSVIEEVLLMDYSGEQFKAAKNEILPSYRELKLKTDKKFIILGCTLKLLKTNSEKLVKEAKKLLVERKNSQPLNEKSCGCFFKNPESSPAGMLIDKTGLKDKRIGGARVSNLHGNFIISEEGCTALDIIKLKELIQKKVKNKFDLTLEPEVKIVGRD
ncbi:MAG: UDP-N-acetylmuramate dehydrogenase [Desulforegulaceae bacterium]|nr:UDP-N-acetylmuramate dehydrogenase [Desulforegulaceae bacterium]